MKHITACSSTGSFLPYFKNRTNSISTNHFVGTIQIHAWFFNRFTKQKMQIFDAMTRGNAADTILMIMKWWATSM